MKNDILKNLIQAILKLDSEKECQKFLRDLCTMSELKAMSERLQVARKVNEGKSYRQISQETGASTATITRVAHWLHHGMGGYQLILDKLKK